MRHPIDQPKVVGQATLCVSDLARALAFYRALGLRPVLFHPHIAVFELRGGTHLLLVHSRGVPSRGPVRSFSLVVGDADAYREHLAAAGMEAGPVRPSGPGHRAFEMADPDGHVLTISSRYGLDRLERAV